MIRVVLAGGVEADRAALAEQLRRRLELDGSGGFALPVPPADLDALDAELSRQGTALDALIHLGGAPESLLDRYPRAVVEVRSSDVDDVLAALREAFVGAG